MAKVAAHTHTHIHLGRQTPSVLLLLRFARKIYFDAPPFVGALPEDEPHLSVDLLTEFLSSSSGRVKREGNRHPHIFFSGFGKECARSGDFHLRREEKPHRFPNDEVI